MTTIRVSDHALVRFLERAGGLDIDALRDALSASLTRAIEAAETLGQDEYTVSADGLRYLIRDHCLITVEHKTLHRRELRGRE